MVEVVTGHHIGTAFSTEITKVYGLANVEALLGPVAWTMGNPNDLGGLLLIVTAIFLSAKASVSD